MIRPLSWWRRWRLGDRRVTLIAMRLDEMVVIHPAQTTLHCRRCSAPVGLYPSGQRVIARYGADRVDVVCQVCQFPGPDAMPAPGARAELGQSARR
jgi:hypothetical protein